MIGRPWMLCVAALLFRNCYEKVSAPKIVSITIPVIDITPRSASLGVGQTMTFIATPPRELAGQPLRWTVSDTTRVSVDQAGHVTAKSVGHSSVVVAVVSDPSVAALATVTVVDSPPALLFQISPRQ